MSASDREEIFRSSNQGLRETLQNQLAAHRNLNQRAIDLVKIDLLAASIVVSGVSLSGIQSAVPYLVVSVVSFLYSTWASVRVFRPRHFSRGLDPVEVDRIQRDASNEMPPDAHHEQLAVAYQNAVADNSSEYLVEAVLFENAVWASVAAVLFAGVAGASVLASLPRITLLLVCVGILLVCLWAKEQYSYAEKVDV